MVKYLLLNILLLFTIAQATGKQLNFSHFNYTNGLSNNRILCFAEDDNGFIWIGTTAGLNRYDGYNFKTFLNSPLDSNSISDDMVQAITKDQLGRLWILTPQGMTAFDPNVQVFSNDLNITINKEYYNLSGTTTVIPYGDSTLFFHLPGYGLIEHNLNTNKYELFEITNGHTSLLSSREISQITISESSLYVLSRNGNINIISLKTKRLEKNIDALKTYIQNTQHDYNLFIDTKQNIWIYSNDHDLGIIFIDGSETIKHFNTESQPALNSNIISSIIQDSDNNYWIGTDHGGLNILSSSKESVQYILHDEGDKNSLSQNVITSIFKSSNDVIWIGTFKQGGNFYHKNLFRFNHYKHQLSVETSLPYNDVNCFAEDKFGNLWIGTNGEGLIYFDRHKNTFKSVTFEFKNTPGLKSNVIVSLFVDKYNHLWIGTYHGGLAYYDGQNITNYLNNPDNPKSISDNRIWEIFEDSNGNLWVGTLGGGLNLFDRDRKEFLAFKQTEFHEIYSDFIIDINEDSKGNLWLGTDFGAYILPQDSSKVIHFTHDKKARGSLSDNFISAIHIDSRKHIWLGTRNGLNLFNAKSNNFILFNTNNGLPNNSIMGILESEEGDIWVSTSGGLCKLVIQYQEDGKYQSHYTINYDDSDGLQGREFNEGSAYKTSKGELIFGGANGFNIYLPSEDEFKPLAYKTKIIGLEIFGEEINVNSNESKKRNIRSSILNGETIKLPYKDNIFSLKFATANYLAAKKIRYRYKLEGFNNQWIYTTWEDRKATFTNLNPGKYVFKVQSSDINAGWENSESFVHLIIQPPWYRTWVSYFAFTLLILTIIVFSRRIVIKNERAKFQQEQIEKESKRQQELNALKTRFFTNVSHEFRTPLTLILTPLEKLIKTTNDESFKKHLSLIQQNAKRLLGLVNQLLDFRKIEENKLQVSYIYGNIIGFIGHIIDSFTDFQESKNISLDFLPDEKELFMQFDKDKLEKILFNLISNAFKFTPENGYIRIFAEVVEVDGTEHLKIIVKDNGIGISEDQLEKIFDRFYQSDLPNDFITKGSGIGLSLAHDFVELLNGSISVQSKINRGSSFIVLLPVNRNSTQDIGEDKIWPEVNNEGKTAIPSTAVSAAKNKKTIMLVEDNSDFRYYLNDSLQSKFNILEAENGSIALETLKTKQPDLIVSDVMMPVMDGLTFCSKIKTAPSFSHIPIILLTAKSTQQDQLDGLHQGADEYITKPFNLEILEARIDYLLAQRKRFATHYQKNFQVEIENNSITPLDEKLLKRTHDLINKNISNSEYSVEKLSKDVGMSRVYLYKKTTSLTGKTPVELIRLVRLKKAANLFLESQLSISEVAYDVGFTDPKYFSKQFKIEYGVLPSKYKENQGL